MPRPSSSMYSSSSSSMTMPRPLSMSSSSFDVVVSGRTMPSRHPPAQDDIENDGSGDARGSIIVVPRRHSVSNEHLHEAIGGGCGGHDGRVSGAPHSPPWSSWWSSSRRPTVKSRGGETVVWS